MVEVVVDNEIRDNLRENLLDKVIDKIEEVKHQEISHVEEEYKP